MQWGDKGIYTGKAICARGSRSEGFNIVKQDDFNWVFFKDVRQCFTLWWPTLTISLQTSALSRIPRARVKEKAAVAYTAKYCAECNRKLSPTDKSPQAKAFIKVNAFTEGSTPPDNSPLTEEGMCDKRGETISLIFYEINGPTTRYADDKRSSPVRLLS
jgi:hypothetical protein